MEDNYQGRNGDHQAVRQDEDKANIGEQEASLGGYRQPIRFFSESI